MLLPFFEGVMAAITSLVLELTPAIFGLKLVEESLLFLVFGAAIEEVVKFIFIYNHYLKLNEKKNILSGAFFIGLGFTLTELFLKQFPAEKNLFLPIAGIFLVHLSTTVLLGLLLRKNSSRPLLFSFFLLFFNFILHFCYNLSVLRNP